MCINIKSRICCCKDCVPPDRHVGCHSSCEKYLKEKQEWNNYKSDLQEHIHKENLIVDFHIRNVERSKRVKTGMF